MVVKYPRAVSASLDERQDNELARMCKEYGINRCGIMKLALRSFIKQTDHEQKETN